jgi:hypothetical protein
VSTSFAFWFRKQVDAFPDGEAQVVDVVVSKSDNLGESDLVVVYQQSAADQRFAIFIEDKIDAPLQPEQAARYRQRAQVGVRKGHFAEFQVVLCSPAAYRDVHPDAALFDAFVSFEEIAEYLRSQSPEDLRAVYRAELTGSLSLGRQPYQMSPAPRMLSSSSRLLTVYDAKPKMPVIEGRSPSAPNRPRATVAT